MNKWIKIPGPGQQAGQGNWFICNNLLLWLYHKDRETLPTYEGERPPKNEKQKSQSEMAMPAMRKSANQES